MAKCDFNKVAWQLRYGCSPVNLLHTFRTPFTKDSSGRLLLKKTHLMQRWIMSYWSNLVELTLPNDGRKHLPKSSPIKNIYSCCDKLIILWCSIYLKLTL